MKKTIRIFLCLIAVLMAGASAKPAHAYGMVIIDPPPPSFPSPPLPSGCTATSTSWCITQITDLSSLTFTFQQCVYNGQVSNTTYTGCFTFDNQTGVDITGLELSVSGATDSAVCPIFSGTDPTQNDVFGNDSCSGSPLIFTGGTITEGEIVTIAEYGADGATVTMDFLTPEPASFWLLGTALFLGTGLVARRRQIGLAALRR